MASYDRADWHSGGDFPEGLDPESGGTHIGFFLAWAVKQHLIGDFHIKESTNSVQLVLVRQMSGREFLFKECDGKFWEEDLNDQGNAFAKAYYATDQYLKQYIDCFDHYKSVYHVDDTWDNYDLIAEKIQSAYEAFLNPQSSQLKKPWWKFW